MDTTEYQIETKKQELLALLTYALKQRPVYLPLVRQIKDEILLCERTIEGLYLRKDKARRGSLR